MKLKLRNDLINVKELIKNDNKTLIKVFLIPLLKDRRK